MQLEQCADNELLKYCQAKLLKCLSALIHNFVSTFICNLSGMRIPIC